jgi:hypothetical protein
MAFSSDRIYYENESYVEISKVVALETQINSDEVIVRLLFMDRVQCVASALHHSSEKKMRK